jgi:membrane protease YdiL (CAAX protease family)
MNTLTQDSLPRSIALHLLPGALGTATYVLLAPILEANGYPALLALLIASGAVIAPLEAGYLLWQARRPAHRPVIGLRQPLPVWQYVALPLLLVVWGFLASGALSAVEPAIAQALFGWLPEWFFFFDAARFSAFSREALWLTFWVGLAVNGLTLPIIEEVYFRGHLLPRLARFGGWAPLLNLALFSLYHFWSPWQIVSRLIWLLPWVYVVHWKRNFYLMLIAHCASNLLGWALTWGLIFATLA